MERKLKIAVLGTRGFPDVQGGVENHCQNLYPLLAGKGCEVVVFSRQPYSKSNSSFWYKGVKLVPLPCPKNKFLETFAHTFYGIFAARAFKPDILHIQAIGPALFVPLARLLGLKVVMTNHGPDYRRKKWGRLAKMVLRGAEFSGTVCAHKVIAISDEIAMRLRKLMRRNIAMIPNGVNFAEKCISTDVLKQFGLVKEKYILCVGRFVPEKGFHDAISAFAMAKQRNPRLKEENWKLVIVGAADHESVYSRRLLGQAKADPDVILTGFLSGQPLKELFSCAGLFILPSYYEGLPIVLLEALSYGLSCIASDIAGNRSIGLAEERYFPAADREKLCEKMLGFIWRGISGEEIEQQKSTLKSKYDWNLIAEATMKVYNTVLKQ